MSNVLTFYSPLEGDSFRQHYNLGELGDHTISGKGNTTDDGLSSGEIKGDPDIVGWGVYYQNVCSASSLNLYRFLSASLPIRPSSMLPPSTFGFHTYARAKWRKKNRTDVQLYSSELTAVEALVLTLGDTHLVSAFAVITASLVKLSKDQQYPLYRLFIASAFAQMSLNSHNVGIYFVYPKFQQSHIGSLGVRTALTSLITIYYLSWNAISLRRFEQWHLDRWPNFTPTCFSYRLNKVPGSFTTWIKTDFVWTPTSYLTYLLVFVRPKKLTKHTKLAKRAESLFDHIDDHVADLIQRIGTKY